eukprot:1979249-Rhodomonas_salina.1
MGRQAGHLQRENDDHICDSGEERYSNVMSQGPVIDRTCQEGGHAIQHEQVPTRSLKAKN